MVEEGVPYELMLLMRWFADAADALMLLMSLMLLMHWDAVAADTDDALILLNQDQLADLSIAFCNNIYFDCHHHDDDILQPLPWAISLVQLWAAPLSLLLASPTPPPCCRLTAPCSCLFQIHPFSLIILPHFHKFTLCSMLQCHRCGQWSGWQPTWLFSGSPAGISLILKHSQTLSCRQSSQEYTRLTWLLVCGSTLELISLIWREDCWLFLIY